MTKSIQQLKEDIAILQEKLRKLEEPKITFENHGDFDVVSYQDPQNSNSGDEIYWRIIQPNSFSWWRRYTIPQRLDMVQNTEKEQELEKLYQEQLQQEMIKRHLKPQGPQGPVGPGPGPKGVIVGYEPTPHTPEQTEKSLREAFQKAQQTEEWKETQRKIDAPKESWMNKPVEELVAMLEKDPPDCLKFVMSKTLEQLIERWWCDVFVGPNEKWTMEECIADLCDRIFLWLPKEQSAAGSQSLGVEDLVDGFNDAIKKIKSKIHNKKVTP